MAFPVASASTPLGTFIDSAPSFLAPVWAFFFDLLSLWAVILLLSAFIRRRWVVLGQTLASLVLAVVLAFVVSRISTGHWPEISAVFGGEFGDQNFRRYVSSRRRWWCSRSRRTSPGRCRGSHAGC